MLGCSPPENGSGPPEAVEIHPSPVVEHDPFALQKLSLDEVAGRSATPWTDFASGVDDPMPGDVGAVAEGRHGVPHLPGVAGHLGERRDGSVRRHPTRRDSTNLVVVAIIGGHAPILARAAPSDNPHPERTMTSDDLRYPNGPFKSVGRALTADERSRHIEVIAEHPQRMRAAVAGLGDAQLDTPYRDGGWSGRQVVHHVVDSHLNAYVRFKLAVTEDHPTIGTYDEKEWAELPDAKSAPIAGSLALLEHLHARWASFLRGLGDEDFRRTFVHPEAGDLTVDVLLEIYGWHGPHHEAHVTRLRGREGW